VNEQVHASGEQSRSDASARMSNDKKYQSGPEFQVSLLSGKTQTYASPRDLREDILRGIVSKSMKARTVAIDKNGKRKESKWSSVERIAAKNAELESLYRPVWAYTMKYLWYGTLAGFVLKALHTTLTIFAADETAGIVWLVVLGSLLFIKKWPFAPVVAVIVSSRLVKANLFITVLATMLVGFVFGGPAGMVIGTLVGHSRKGSCPVAPDAEPEGLRPYLLGVVLPLIILAIAVPLYIWLNWKMAQWRS